MNGYPDDNYDMAAALGGQDPQVCALLALCDRLDAALARVDQLIDHPAGPTLLRRLLGV